MREGVGKAAMSEQRGGSEDAGCREERSPRRGRGRARRGWSGGWPVGGAGRRRERREVRVEGLRCRGGRGGVGRRRRLAGDAGAAASRGGRRRKREVAGGGAMVSAREKGARNAHQVVLKRKHRIRQPYKKA